MCIGAEQIWVIIKPNPVWWFLILLESCFPKTRAVMSVNVQSSRSKCNWNSFKSLLYKLDGGSPALINAAGWLKAWWSVVICIIIKGQIIPVIMWCWVWNTGEGSQESPGNDCQRVSPPPVNSELKKHLGYVMCWCEQRFIIMDPR